MSMTIPSALQEGRNLWDRHARRDPLWAILSDADKKDGKWDVSRFFDAGVNEIESLWYELDSQGIVLGHGAALDFGCGVGRLTQALVPHFDRVTGVDISAHMQELATRVNRFPQVVSYVCNVAPDLEVFPDNTFDFIVSTIVLQHIRPDIALSYVREFCRVLKPRGLSVFQLPSHRRRHASRAPIAAPMPDAAYQASLNLAACPAAALLPGTEVTLEVSVSNVSAFEWSRQKFGVIAVGNHWLDGADGRMLARDDGRTSLPDTLRPGETCRLSLMIKLPADPGRYQCEIDLAHEGVALFQDKGSPGVRFAVRSGLEGEAATGASVPPAWTGRLAAPPEPAPIGGIDTGVDDPGEFPMYGVPLHSALALIDDQRATLVHIESDHSCGDDWVSYRYFVQKREG